jgi:hypothetical protein
MNTNCPVESLLLLSASERRLELQTALQQSLQLSVSIATSFADALSELANAQHSVVVLDEALCDLDPEGMDVFFSRCTGEFPIFVKLAISGAPRCVKQVELGLRRFELEEKVAMCLAHSQVRAQVCDALTTILVHGHLAKDTPGLPAEAGKNITAIVEAGESLNQALSASLT